MKFILIVVSFFVLVGCSEESGITKSKKWDWLPEDLQDCKVYQVIPNNGPNMTVFRCPNSITTTTQHGKHPVTSVVIDGQEFVRKEQ